MSKIYRTAQGQEVDMGALVAKNETVRAVGNMNVNARGDVLDSNNKVIEKKSAQVQKQYRKQIGNTTTSSKIYSSKKAAERAALADNKPVTEKVEIEEALPSKPIEQPDPVIDPAFAEEPAEETKGGLAGAIAKVKDSK